MVIKHASYNLQRLYMRRQTVNSLMVKRLVIPFRSRLDAPVAGREERKGFEFTSTDPRGSLRGPRQERDVCRRVRVYHCHLWVGQVNPEVRPASEITEIVDVFRSILAKAH